MITRTTVAPATFPRHRSAPGRPRLTALLQYAILAPSSHNTQPWMFAVSDDEIRVFVDRERWLRIADPDQRELYVSVGCALENLLVAAARYGYRTRVWYVSEDRADGLAAVVRFDTRGDRPDQRSALFEALPARQTNRRSYDDRPLARDVVTRLYAAIDDDGVQLSLVTEPETARRLQDLLIFAERTQFADPAYRRELGESIGLGAFGDGWLKARMGGLIVRRLDVGRSAARRDAARLQSAPAMGLLTSLANDRGSQVRAGQAFERLALTATSMGVALQPMSAVLELPLTRAAVAELLPEEVFPQHVFRLGYAQRERRRSPRRPLADVLRPAGEEGGL